MKKIISILFLAICLSWITGCDVIDNPVVDYGTYRQDLYGAPPEFGSSGDPHRVVLLEDFTGHDCGNCPNGHAVAATLLENNPEDVAVIAIHAGTLAEPAEPNYPADWRTSEGQYYLLTQVGVDEMPKGRINRTPSAATVYNPSGWTSRVNTALTLTPAVNLQLDVSYVPEAQHLNIHVNQEWFEDLTGEYRLVILITESHIIAPQLWYNHDPEYIADYEHEHMLRATITGATGLALANDPQSGYTRTDSYTFDWLEQWIPENCEIVAYITNGENGVVMNAQKLAVVQ